MTNRRQFLAGSLAGTAIWASLPALATTQRADRVRTTLDGFVFDERFESSAVMAQHFGTGVTRAYPMRGDVSEVWYGALDRSVQSGSRTIGGLTTAGGLFVLSRLGHDAGLTLALHGQHRVAMDGRSVEHALHATPAVTKQFDDAVEGGLPWTSALQVAMQEASSWPTADRLPLLEVGVSGTSGQVTMHSWLLMPRV